MEKEKKVRGRGGGGAENRISQSYDSWVVKRVPRTLFIQAPTTGASRRASDWFSVAVQSSMSWTLAPISDEEVISTPSTEKASMIPRLASKCTAV